MARRATTGRGAATPRGNQRGNPRGQRGAGDGAGRSARVALVTGAGQRVGQAIALALAADDFRVAVHYHRSATGARQTVRAIEAAGGRATAFRADLSRAGEPARLVAAVIGTMGRLDVVVNSAASLVRTPLASVRERHWDAVLALNLRAPFFTSVAAAAELRRRRGVIVNISDHMGFEPWPEFVPHGVSKAGVAALTRALAAALAPRVRVNAVAPGFVLAPAGMPRARQRAFARATPLRRLGSPADVAEAVRYLVGATYVTGDVLFVDGGRHGAR